jgi:hypothetical protein
MNPENDPVRVDLESTLYVVAINLACSSPSPNNFSLEVVGLATLLCALITLKEMQRDLASSCFKVGNCPCKAAGSRPSKSSCQSSI